MTTGICDAYTIGNALVRVCRDQAPATLVREAANDRRETWLKTTDKLSQLFLKRIRSEEPEDVKERDQFFANLKTDPEMPNKVRGLIEQIAGMGFEGQHPKSRDSKL